MSYPQFVEVLTLLATSASSRLRLLYPDVAGSVQSATKEASRNSGGLSESSADTTTSLAGRSPVESDSLGVGVTGDDNEKTTNAAGQLVHRTALNVRAAMKLKTGRYVRIQGGRVLLYIPLRLGQP